MHRRNKFNHLIGGQRISVLARNTFSMLAGSGARVLIQGFYFVLIARALGAEQYGAFIGVVALVAILSPFASFGTGQILVRNVARDRATFGYSWGNALWTTAVAGSMLLGVVLLLAKYVLAHRLPVELVLLVGCSDLLFSPVVNVGALAFVAVERLHRTVQVNIAQTSARALSALALFCLVSHPTAVWWGFLYCLSSGGGAVYAVFLVSSKLGSPSLSLGRLRLDLLEGFYFAISQAAQSIYNNIDKTMLVRLATFGAAGIYAAAYRLVDLSFRPINALLASIYPRFFQHGVQGLGGTKRFAKRFLPVAAAYAILAGAGLFLVAPLLPRVLGADFGTSVVALRWLAPLVLFRVFHYLFADALTGAGFQGPRSAVQLFVAGLNVGLNLWLIPAYSWRGAAWASLVSDGTLVVGMFTAVAVLGRTSRAAASGCGAEPRIVQ